MLNDRQQFERRNAILRILRGGVVHRQSDLAQLLRRDGFDVTQSSVSRDLRELGVLKASGRYRVPADEISRANGDFGALAAFVRAIRPAGSSITVIRTSIGAAPTWLRKGTGERTRSAACWRRPIRTGSRRGCERRTLPRLAD